MQLAIYTTTSWWTTCTGNSAAFASTNPLWVARYASSVGSLPAGWGYETFWQYADSGSNPGDQDTFNGDMTQLKKSVDICTREHMSDTNDPRHPQACDGLRKNVAMDEEKTDPVFMTYSYFDHRIGCIHLVTKIISTAYVIMHLSNFIDFGAMNAKSL